MSTGVMRTTELQGCNDASVPGLLYGVDHFSTNESEAKEQILMFSPVLI